MQGYGMWQPVSAEAFLCPLPGDLELLLSRPTMVERQHRVEQDLRILLRRAVDLLEMVEAANRLLDAQSEIAFEHRTPLIVQRTPAIDVFADAHRNAALRGLGAIILDAHKYAAPLLAVENDLAVSWESDVEKPRARSDFPPLVDA